VQVFPRRADTQPDRSISTLAGTQSSMPQKTFASLARAQSDSRAIELFQQHQLQIWRHTDRLFGTLMLLQWPAAVAAALWISPRTWAGSTSHVHVHVWTALFLGGALTLYPLLLILTQPGKASTRHTIALGQMSMSALLIHLTGGRIETHFHVFGSL